MSIPLDSSRHGHSALNPGTVVRKSVAAVCIIVFAGAGFYAAWMRGEWDFLHSVLLYLAVTLGPATMCAFGYFVCMPDVLGVEIQGGARSLTERWSGFARLSAAIAAVIGWIGWVITSVQNWESNGIAFAVGAILCPALIPAVAVASEKYLERTFSPIASEPSIGWRARVRRMSGKYGLFLTRVFGARTALLAGSALILVSLVLGVSYDGAGYEVLSGKGMWITAEFTISDALALPRMLANQASRWVYGLGILTALAAVAAISAGPKGNRLRRWPPLLFVSCGIAVYAILDFAFGFQRFVTFDILFGSVPPKEILLEKFSLGTWIAVLVLPIAISLWRARSGGKRSEHTRLAVMVLYLTILFFFLAVLPTLLVESLAPGYALFLLGTMLLWWGFVQSGWEAAPA